MRTFSADSPEQSLPFSSETCCLRQAGRACGPHKKAALPRAHQGSRFLAHSNTNASTCCYRTRPPLAWALFSQKTQARIPASGTTTQPPPLVWGQNSGNCLCFWGR